MTSYRRMTRAEVAARVRADAVGFLHGSDLTFTAPLLQHTLSPLVADGAKDALDFGKSRKSNGRLVTRIHAPGHVDGLHGKERRFLDHVEVMVWRIAVGLSDVLQRRRERYRQRNVHEAERVTLEV